MALDELRRPFLLAAMVLALAVILVEVGSMFFSEPAGLSATTRALAEARPGYGIPFLAALDFLLLYSLVLQSLSLLSREITGRLQGLVGLIVSLLALVVLIAMIFFAFNLLIMMVSLLLSPIFGTIAYFAIFGHFSRGAAAGALSLMLVLKIALAVCLVLAQPAFVKNKRLVLLILLSIGGTLLIAFLHAWPPGFLASITDIVAALIIAIVALIWALILLIGSVFAVVKAV